MGVGFEGFGLKLSATDDFAGTGGAGQYLEASYERDLGSGFGINLHVGQSTFDSEVGAEDYLDYKVSLSKALGRVGLDLAFIDTDENQFGNLDDERIVFAISVAP